MNLILGCGRDGMKKIRGNRNRRQKTEVVEERKRSLHGSKKDGVLRTCTKGERNRTKSITVE